MPKTLNCKAKMSSAHVPSLTKTVSVRTTSVRWWIPVYLRICLVPVILGVLVVLMGVLVGPRVDGRRCRV